MLLGKLVLFGKVGVKFNLKTVRHVAVYLIQNAANQALFSKMLYQCTKLLLRMNIERPCIMSRSMAEMFLLSTGKELDTE